MPLVRYSRIDSFVNAYTASGVSLASSGKICSNSHGCSGTSSAYERTKLIPACACAFLKPGMTRSPPRSISRSNAGSVSGAGPT